MITKVKENKDTPADPFFNIISTKEAARILKKTDRQIRNDCKNGKLIARLLDPTDTKSPWMIYLPHEQSYPTKD